MAEFEIRKEIKKYNLALENSNTPSETHKIQDKLFELWTKLMEVRKHKPSFAAI